MTDLSMSATAEALATLIEEKGVELELSPFLNATADPRRASTSGPIVLVNPPVRDYRQKADTFNLMCLPGTTTQDLDTLRKLSALLEQLRAVLPGMVEEARPTQYRLTGPDGPALPAYACRIVTSIPQE